MASKTKPSARKWSAEVTKTSNALDLEPGVFTWKDPGRIARSLAYSAQKSKRRKTGEFQSAMSMLNFYVNRAGKNLPKHRRRVLDEAKEKLREIYKKF